MRKENARLKMTRLGLRIRYRGDMAKRKRTPSTPNISPDFMREKEKMMNAAQKALRDMKIDSPEEANAFLSQFVGMHMADVTKALGGDATDDLEEQANEMFFEAMESRTRFAAKRKLAAVLKLDPGHVRALTALAMMESSPAKIETALRTAILAGERRLGPLLQEGHGELWGFLEARPYMEARAELAEFLAGQEGRQDDAIREHQELLRLNENDNQGIRDTLLALLLETRRFDDARALVKKYDTDHAATWMYSKALLAFEQHAAAARWDTTSHDQAWLERQMHGMAAGMVPDIPKPVRKADKALIKALKFNPWCAIYLFKTGEHLDDELPEYYSAGTEEEALLFVGHHANAWVKNPSALLWLMLTAMPWLIKNGYEAEIEP